MLGECGLSETDYNFYGIDLSLKYAILMGRILNTEYLANTERSHELLIVVRGVIVLVK